MSTVITLTEAQHRFETILLSGLKDRVAGGEDVSCRYFNDDGSPSCIVGYAFEAELKEIHVAPGLARNETSVGELVTDYDLSIEPLAEKYLSFAQEQQDFGHPWGDAIAYAEEQIGHMLAEQEAIETTEQTNARQLPLAA